MLRFGSGSSSEFAFPRNHELRLNPNVVHVAGCSILGSCLRLFSGFGVLIRRRRTFADPARSPRLTRCKFCVTHLRYQGFTVASGGISRASRKTVGIHRFTDLRAWQACYTYKNNIYRLCERGRLSTDWKLRRQLEDAVWNIFSRRRRFGTPVAPVNVGSRQGPNAEP